MQICHIFTFGGLKLQKTIFGRSSARADLYPIHASQSNFQGSPGPSMNHLGTFVHTYKQGGKAAFARVIRASPGSFAPRQGFRTHFLQFSV